MPLLGLSVPRSQVDLPPGPEAEWSASSPGIGCCFSRVGQGLGCLVQHLVPPVHPKTNRESRVLTVLLRGQEQRLSPTPFPAQTQKTGQAQKVPELRLREQRHCPHHPQHTHPFLSRGVAPAPHKRGMAAPGSKQSLDGAPLTPLPDCTLDRTAGRGLPGAPFPFPEAGSPRSATLPSPWCTPGPDPSGSNRKPPREAG